MEGVKLQTGAPNLHFGVSHRSEKRLQPPWKACMLPLCSQINDCSVLKISASSLFDLSLLCFLLSHPLTQLSVPTAHSLVASCPLLPTFPSPSFQLLPIPSFFPHNHFFRPLPTNMCINSYEQQLLGTVLPLPALFVYHCIDWLQCPQGRGPKDHFTGLFSLTRCLLICFYETQSLVATVVSYTRLHTIKDHAFDSQINETQNVSLYVFPEIVSMYVSWSYIFHFYITSYSFNFFRFSIFKRTSVSSSIMPFLGIPNIDIAIPSSLEVAHVS